MNPEPQEPNDFLVYCLLALAFVLAGFALLAVAVQ